MNRVPLVDIVKETRKKKQRTLKTPVSAFNRENKSQVAGNGAAVITSLRSQGFKRKRGFLTLQESQLETDGYASVMLIDSLKWSPIIMTLAVLRTAIAILFPCLLTGSSSDVQTSKKRVSSKLIVIILLICVVLTAIASLASLLCYAYTRDKCPIQRPLFSSDRDSSNNSATNLINHRTKSVPEYSFYIGSPDNRMIGCVRKSSFSFRSRAGTLHGTIKQFPYSELENATNKFSDSNLIGLGGSSHVYRGHLKDGRIVAVKRMRALLGPDAEFVFATEIELISRLHHCHVVPLLGYCSEYQGKKHPERLLVFEYMARGNLRECLDAGSGKSLDWVTRVEIALGAARGLEYLHEAAAPRILHRDVKSTNILLDENWRAKITDLGMAKRLTTDGLPSCTNSPARMQGTFGYFAPEYAIIGRASPKSDVFSFGVVLLELISGRHPIHKSDKREESLVIWAMPLLQDSRRVILELPDPHLQGKFPEEEMQIVAYLTKECLLMDPDSRPTMSEVVQILSTIVSEKSRRRNFQLNIFQSLSMHGPKPELEIETTDKQQVQTQVGSEELKRMATNKWSPRLFRRAGNEEEALSFG
ncbi:hypothetical protein LguiA_012268 [Lonicera macranthoides]